MTYPASTFFRIIAVASAGFIKQRPELRSHREYKLRPPLLGPFVIAGLTQPKRYGPLQLRDLLPCELDEALREFAPKLSKQDFKRLMLQLPQGEDWLENWPR